MSLRDLCIGQTAAICTVGGVGALRQHFLDMGVIPGAEVSVVKYAPMGDPMELLIHGYELTLRLDDAAKIDVEPKEQYRAEHPDEPPMQKSFEAAELAAPETVAVGESRESSAAAPKQAHAHAQALPEGTQLTFALVGNQNCGKTTLFNRLTGSNQHVGNFPGVTVDRKDGVIIGHKDTLVTDLPGIYSMSPYSSEEIVSRNFVVNDKPKAIINILDATVTERNLYLTLQLLEMDVPMVVALNMMDELTENGGSIDVKKMSEMLGVPVVPISAAKNQGIDELIEKAVQVAKYQQRPAPSIFGADAGADRDAIVQETITAVSELIRENAQSAGVPVRFAASKLIEGDELIAAGLMPDDAQKDHIEQLVQKMEQTRGLDRSAAIADMRYSCIYRICDACVTKPKESKQSLRSEKIDRILTGKWTAIPVFVLIMAAVFFLTFNVIGGTLQDLLQTGLDGLTAWADSALTAAGVNVALHGLIVDGILEGVGCIVEFLPIIVTLFFFLSLLEDSGYIARVAFFMDKLLRKIGLSGKSIVPMLIGFGCSVPAVMATRTLPSERDKKMTILLTPFMSCSAKMPIYAFFVNAIFPDYKALIMVGLYFLGIMLGILAAFIYRKTLFSGEPVPFVMELPNYRLPSPKNVVQLLWEKAKDFLERAFTVILLATIIIWLLQSFDLSLHYVSDQQQSILAAIAGGVSFVMKPVGLGDWRICTALISGFMAKESVVSTLEVLLGSHVSSVLSGAAAASLLVFALLYTPCVATIASIRREMGGKWAVFVVVAQCAVAWVVAFAVYWFAVAVLHLA